MQLTAALQDGGSIPGRPTCVGAQRLDPNRRFAWPQSAALPLNCCLFCSSCSLHCLKPSLLLKNNPNCVFLSACLLAQLTVCLTN